ncbi:MAG: hypothetical protein DWQ33_02150 [Bacteroidetes bacterium]|nr:MAG: hypothetical protein DWQ33_02150 [Bacteroidota bacterium]
MNVPPIAATLADAGIFRKECTADPPICAPALKHENSNKKSNAFFIRMQRKQDWRKENEFISTLFSNFTKS